MNHGVSSLNKSAIKSSLKSLLVILPLFGILFGMGMGMFIVGTEFKSTSEMLGKIAAILCPILAILTLSFRHYFRHIDSL